MNFINLRDEIRFGKLKNEWDQENRVIESRVQTSKCRVKKLVRTFITTLLFCLVHMAPLFSDNKWMCPPLTVKNRHITCPSPLRRLERVSAWKTICLFVSHSTTSLIVCSSPLKINLVWFLLMNHLTEFSIMQLGTSSVNNSF